MNKEFTIGQQKLLNLGFKYKKWKYGEDWENDKLGIGFDFFWQSEIKVLIRGNKWVNLELFDVIAARMQEIKANNYTPGQKLLIDLGYKCNKNIKNSKGNIQQESWVHSKDCNHIDFLLCENNKVEINVWDCFNKDEGIAIMVRMHEIEQEAKNEL